MIGTSSERAWFTAVLMAPDEPSTCSIAGERRSIKETAPSAASTGSFRATFLISVCACLMRWIAGCDFATPAVPPVGFLFAPKVGYAALASVDLWICLPFGEGRQELGRGHDR